MTTLFLLAQSAAVDPISGGAGWVGAGLLGLVLSWLLLVHLPAKDKQLREILDRHDASQEKLRIHHEQSEKALRDTFSAALKEITEHCKEELSTIVRGGMSR